MADRFTGPGPDAIYASHLREGRFMIQRCAICAQHVFYPRLLCTRCGRPELDFVPASGRGLVYSTTVQRRRPEQGGDQNVALVDLEEGPRLMTRVDGLAPSEVRPGLAVEVRIVHENDRRFVVFVPA